MVFPEHKGSLSLSHNGHKNNYETVREYLLGYDDEDILPDDREACIAADEVWELQWYPYTPIGYIIVLGPTIERVLERANEREAS